MLPASVEELAADQWRRRIDLGITGLMNVIGAFVPQLVEAAGTRGVADLINTSSIAAQNIFPNFAVYSATKAYVTHLSRHLRAEPGARNVRASAIEPGIVGTELQDHVTDEGARAWLEGSKETMEWLTLRRMSRGPSGSSRACRLGRTSSRSPSCLPAGPADRLRRRAPSVPLMGVTGCAAPSQRTLPCEIGFGPCPSS
ncbi:SDR family oxidoreductase [Streptosporangium algeriense]|uniref:SDR family oxidoreductase n=1 Tax=Streptosporangium algeriense TaxID=1682748 RepID=A0ABW3DL60_9ACTN